MQKIIFLLLFFVLSKHAIGQSFQNGELDGVVNGLSSLPVNWQNVPYTDVNCLAFQVGNDTPDLTNLTQPNQMIGINGNAYTGETFVSGLFAKGAPNFFQEGIMQLVSGFIVGESYLIHFRQTVVRNINALDKSGSWAVFADTILLDITPSSYSNESYGTNNLLWEARSLTFKASSNSHLIKFLPMDDDSSWAFSTTDTTGALRMGIDSIGLVALIDGLDEDSYGEAFKVFPNPNNGNFTLECNTSNKLTCSIINIRGEKVYSNMLHPLNNKINIDVSYLPKGVYTLKVYDDKMVGYSKVVIQ